VSTSRGGRDAGHRVDAGGREHSRPAGGDARGAAGPARVNAARGRGAAPGRDATRGQAAAPGRDAARGRGARGRGEARGRGAEHGLGGEQVEGRRAVRELLATQLRPVRDVWLSETVERGPVVAEIIELAEEAGVPLRLVPRGRLDAEARTDAPQGVIAHARALEEAELVELCTRRAGAPVPFLVVLDGVTDPQNLGALLRTAEVAGATGIVLARHRAAHITPTVAKAAAGAIEHLPITIVAGVPAALSTIAAHGVWTVGLDAQARTSVWDLELATEAVALVLGSEGSGMSRLSRERCEMLVAVPQQGRLESLNVAAAGAIAAFEVARRRTSMS